jgi:hypothetical protein
MRCWNKHRMGKTVTVECLRGPDGPLKFCYHPSGEELGDAEAVLERGTEAGKDLARKVGDVLAVRM